jgi:hypothetical protein
MNFVAGAGGRAMINGAVASCSWIFRSLSFAALVSAIALATVVLMVAVETAKQLDPGHQITTTAEASTSQRHFYKTMNYRAQAENPRPWIGSTLLSRGSSATSSTSFPSSADGESTTLDSSAVGTCEQLLGKPSGTPDDQTRTRATEYGWGKPTEVNHGLLLSESNDDSTRIGYESPFAEIRSRLDRSFHEEYCPERQRFQDSVILSMLQRNQLVHQQEFSQMSPSRCSFSVNEQPRPLDAKSPTSSTAPWIVFSAGAMGAGKTWTVKLLQDKGRFPLDKFLMVDPDVIRHCLPEFDTYVKVCPDRAGELTRMESGMMAEILVKAALNQGRNVLVDGSLRNASWYLSYFERLRQDYQGIRIAILHVTAPRDVIFSRALVRRREPLMN